MSFLKSVGTALGGSGGQAGFMDTVGKIGQVGQALSDPLGDRLAFKHEIADSLGSFGGNNFLKFIGLMGHALHGPGGGPSTQQQQPMDSMSPTGGFTNGLDYSSPETNNVLQQLAPPQQGIAPLLQRLGQAFHGYGAR